MSEVINELHPTLLGHSSINGMHAHIHAVRGAMMTGNLGQRLVIPGATRRRLRSDTEFLFSDTTFMHKFNGDVEIVAVIHRYPRSDSRDAIRSNPQTLVVYQDNDTREFGLMDINKYHSMHQAFGFRFKMTDAFDQLAPGQTFERGTVVAKPPTVTDDGDYMYGLEANFAFMTHPAVIEDGALVSESFLKKISPTRYEKRTISFGGSHFPVNIEGDASTYKIMPDIGERVSGSGLLMALRALPGSNEAFAVSTMSNRALLTVDYQHDRRINADPNALIVDIRVERNDRLPRNVQTPVGMDEQLMKYYLADIVFYRKILDCYWELHQKWGGKPMITPEFHWWVVQAYAHLHLNPDYRDFPNAHLFKGLPNQVDKVSRSSKMDEWVVEITFETQSDPNRGFKMTGMGGNKCVICATLPDDQMPVDANGNVADVVMDPISISKRINPGVFIEHYVNGSARETTLRAMDILQYHVDSNTPRSMVQSWFNNPSHYDRILEAFDYVVGWYDVTGPMAAKVLRDMRSDRSHVIGFMMDVCLEGIYPHWPTDNPVHVPTVLRTLKANYRPVKGPVRYADLQGNPVTSLANVLIASCYVMVLEKTGEDWSAVATPKLSHYGTTARLTSFDKYSEPVRFQATKTIGESEARALAAAMGAEALADIMHAYSDPVALKHIQRSILSAEHPTRIDEVLSREAVPKGGHRPLNFINHVFECSGKRIVDAVREKRHA